MRDSLKRVSCLGWLPSNGCGSRSPSRSAIGGTQANAEVPNTTARTTTSFQRKLRCGGAHRGGDDRRDVRLRGRRVRELAALVPILVLSAAVNRPSPRRSVTGTVVGFQPGE